MQLRARTLDAARLRELPHLIAWAQRQRLRSADARLLLLTLARFADREGRVYLAQPFLAERLGVPVATISRLLKSLEDSGAISRRARYAKADGQRVVDEIRLRTNEG